MKRLLGIICLLSLFGACNALATDFSVATGKPSLSWHNTQYELFVKAVKRLYGDKFDVERAFPDKGTDGSIANIRFVSMGEQANVGFTQDDARVLENASNTTAFGPFGYEVANMVYKKGSKFKDCDALETSKARVGINTQSGAMVTWSVYGKVDKEYTEASIVDIPRGSMAKVAFDKGEIDAYYWVGAPSLKGDQKRFLMDPTIEFGSCTDSDFKDYTVNGQVLYPKVVFSKGEAEKLGYGKKKIKTHLIGDYILVNNVLLEEDENLYDVFTDIAAYMYRENANRGINKYWYPSK